MELEQKDVSTQTEEVAFKVLVGISPDRAITFVSSLFPISDKALTRESGILDLLRPSVEGCTS